MAQELPPPIEPKNSLLRIPESLKQAVKNRTIGAVNKLIGAYAPRILADAQAAKDERDARSLITAEIAKAAGKKAADNPEIVDRMLARLAGDEVGRQTNREAIATKALGYLGEDAASTEDGVPTQAALNEDWLNLYGAFAERASSENLQDMWARVLAGEIRKPGSFSLSTLQLVSILDMQSATIINKAMPWVVDGRWVPLEGVNHEISVGEFVFLEELGFGSGSGATLSAVVKPESDGLTIVRANKVGFVVDNEQKSFDVTMFNLSLAGRQLAKIISVEPKADKIQELLERQKPKTIKRGRVIETEEEYTIVDAKLVFERPAQ